VRARWLALIAILFGLTIQAAMLDNSSRKPEPPPSIEHRASNIENLPSYFATGILTLQDRIWAQTQIERVWYNHRIWPKENSGPKPPFEQMVPAALIEKKATDVLRMGAALKQYWNIEITPPMLQSELDRMERESKDRATLHELFSALRDDPFLIAETLARGNVAQQLLYVHTDYDERLSVGAIYSIDRSDFYTIPGPLIIMATMCDVWTATSTGTNVPTARYIHTAVWTGSEMIIWGGLDGAVGLNSGGRYSPATNTWLATSTGTNVPSVRYWHTSVWTGSEMIIWGGYDGVSSVNTGGRYNPTTDTWLTTSIGTNVPDARQGHTAVWTGNRMIIWGGDQNTGGRYDPSNDSWQPTSTGMNVPDARSGNTAIWTGSEMIVWGGGFLGAGINTGGRYNPVTDTWIATSIGANVAVGSTYPTSVWTGDEMIVWGGVGFSFLNSGGRYKPATDTWLTTSTGVNVPAVRYGHTAIWTGSEMIIWGGYGGVYLNTGGRYSPVSDTWLATSIGANAPDQRQLHSTVWTGSAMIIWGGASAVPKNTGGIYTPGTPGPVGTTLRGGKSATVNLSWTAASGATSYNVKRCVAACTPSTIIATPATNNYSEAMNATSYFYAVEAVNQCGATP
jgi:hypothetical protein